MMGKSILFYNEDINFNLLHKTRIRQLIKALAKQENRQVEAINYIFCSDNYLLEINKKYLHADYLTDVITFDYCQENSLSGDVFISIERVKENAKIFQAKFFDEALRVIIHGALHLCGYKDKKPNEEKQMRAKEDYYLDVFEQMPKK